MAINSIGDLKHDKRNPRKHNPRNLKVIVDSLHDVGFARSIVIDENDEILAGNGVTEAAAIAGIERVVEVEADGNTIIAVRRRGLTDEQKQRLKYFDNRSGELAEWEPSQLLADMQAGLDLSGMFDEHEMDALLAEMGNGDGGVGDGANGEGMSQARATLSERFLVPPFSVLDARQGYWQERKRAWIALGIQSELGRGENALDVSATMAGITDEEERAACSTQRRESPRRKPNTNSNVVNTIDGNGLKIDADRRQSGERRSRMPNGKRR